MNISDKKFVDFSEQVWERNKELVAENKKLRSDLEKAKKEIERLGQVCEDYFMRIEELEEENQDYALSNDCLRSELENYMDIASVSTFASSNMDFDNLEEEFEDDLPGNYTVVNINIG